MLTQNGLSKPSADGKSTGDSCFSGARGGATLTERSDEASSVILRRKRKNGKRRLDAVLYEVFSKYRMSNKLVKHQEPKETLTVKQKKILFWSCFIILSIACVAVWINVFLTSKALHTQMEDMVLGEDYYREDVVITDKRVEAASTGTISRDYFFYYNNGKAKEYHKRMQVPKFIYSEYDVGDSITAYTTDHEGYSYYKYGILPDTEYKNNELMKVAGALLVNGIFLLSLLGGLEIRMS